VARTSYVLRLAWSVAALAVLAAMPVLPQTASTAVQISPRLTSGGVWLDRFNQWRMATGLPTVVENTTWSAGDYNHSLYMVKNDLVTHYETPGVPYYTVEGDTAARNGNLNVSSTTATPDDAAIDWWMGAPFHAMGMMDPRLTTTGFGSYREVKSGWQFGATLDVVRGNSFTGGKFPVMFPANGSTEPLTQYSGNEWPDPLQACPGYSTPTGLPLFIELGGNVSTTASATHSLTANGVAVEHCVIDSTNAALGSFLTERGGVIVIPRQPLASGANYVVSLTVNGTPYTWSFTVGALRVEPQGWSSLGGVLTSTPAASSWGSGTADVFVRGADNALWHRHFDGTNWGAWESLGGIITSDPSAVSNAAGHIDVFARGGDSGIWHRAFNGTTWSAWDSVGGVATTGPSVTSWGSGRLDLVVAGANNYGTWHKTWNGTAWGAWESLGGVAAASPSVVSSGANSLDVFVRGGDGALWRKHGDGAGTWSTWSSMGGIFTGAPAPASCASGHLDVFVQGIAGGIWHQGFNGTAWSGWQQVGGFWTSGPGAVCPTGATAVDLFSRGPDYGLWFGTAPGS